MSEDKQDNEHAGDSSDDTVMEQRAAKKQGSYLGTLLLLAILTGVGVAAGYYQSMWLPQAEQLLAKLIPMQEEVDPMAAPRLENAGTEKPSNESNSDSYALLPAIIEKEPAEEVTKDVVEELPVIPATTELVAEPAVSDDVKDMTNDVVMDEEPATSSSPVETVEGVSPVSSNTATAQVKAPEAVAVVNDTGAVSLAQARQAFWARDLVKAETLYRELLEHESGTADAWGELGNLYYGQAKWQQAAEAYSEAAIQLLGQGQYQQAMFLHYVVRGLDPVQAGRIDAKLRAMQATPQE